MSDYCDACRETLTYIGRKVKLCPKHAAVDDYIEDLGKAIKEIEHLKKHSWCAYCGFEINLDDDAASQIKKHIHTCELHPLTKVTKQRDDLLVALKMVEWAGDSSENIDWCPWCYKDRPLHEDDCPRQRAIAEAE